MNESAPRPPNRLQADLAKAMRSTAEAAKLASIDPCRAEAEAYIDALRAQTANEAGSIGQTAEADVAGIRLYSEGQVERIHVEAEQRIARRRELLDQELQEYNAGIEIEVKQIEERVVEFQNEVARFFDLLLDGDDPQSLPRWPRKCRCRPTSRASTMRRRKRPNSPIVSFKMSHEPRSWRRALLSHPARYPAPAQSGVGITQSGM